MNYLHTDTAKLGVCVATTVGFALYAVSAWQLDTGNMASPGPGVVPRGIAVIGLVAATVHTLGTARKLASSRVPARRPEDDTKHAHPNHTLTAHELLRLAGALAALALLAALTPVMGFAFSAFVAALILARLAGQRSWWKSTATGLGVSVVVSFLFVTVLAVPLPAGLLG